MVAAAAIGGAVIGGVASNSAASKQSSAAKNAARTQAASADAALEQSERLNAPYLALGESAIPQYQQFVDDPSGATYLENNPLFQQALDYTGNQLKTVGSSTGKLNSGGMIQSLFNNYLATGDQFVNSAQNRAFQPVQLGQNAANFQASNSGNLITGAGNAQAAGLIGAGNAQAAGINGVGSAISGALGSYSMNQPQNNPQQGYYMADGEYNPFG